MTEPTRRVRIQRQTTARSTRLEMIAEIDAQTVLGEALIKSLMRAQLRLAASVLGVLAMTLGALPVVFANVPIFTERHLAGIPLPWILLGLLVYPFLLALGWYYVVHSERNENAFIDVLDDP